MTTPTPPKRSRGVTKKPAQKAVEKAVRAELRSLSVSVQGDGSAALAVALSKQIDSAKGAASAALAAAQLRQLLIDLRAFAAQAKPRRSEIDAIRDDELAARRRSG